MGVAEECCLGVGGGWSRYDGGCVGCKAGTQGRVLREVGVRQCVMWV